MTITGQAQDAPVAGGLSGQLSGAGASLTSGNTIPGLVLSGGLSGELSTITAQALDLAGGGTITGQFRRLGTLTLSQVLELDWEGWRTEPRGWHGKWARTGNDIAEKAAAWAGANAGKISPHEVGEYDAPAYERDVLDPAYHYTPAQKDAISQYTEKAFSEINATARGDEPERGGLGAEKVRAVTSALDSAMQPLPQDVTLLREISGKDALSHLGRGDIIANDGFSSTAIRAGRFAGGKGDTTIMHVIAPKGTPSIWTGPVSGYKEDEVILSRGQPMALLKSAPQPGRTDITHVWLVALPKEAVS